MEEQDTGEIDVLDDERRFRYAILAELQSIRYRLGILVLFLVVIPIVVTIVWLFVEHN